MGFQRVESGRSVYVWEKDGCKVITPVFMDDLTIVSKSRAMVDKVKAVLNDDSTGGLTSTLGASKTGDRSMRTIPCSPPVYIDTRGSAHRMGTRHDHMGVRHGACGE